MGQSTDAILCWGVQLDEHDEVPWGAKARELGGYSDPLEDEAIVYVLTGERLVDDSAAERLKGLGIEIVMHGHYEDPAIIIAAVGSVTTAHRGYPQIIDPNRMALLFRDDPIVGWRGGLHKALPKLGINHLVPRWTLCSWWSC